MSSARTRNEPQPPPSGLHGLRLDQLRGIGPARLKQLERLGIRTADDLLHHFPRRYEEESAESAIAQLRPEQIGTVRGTVVAVNYIPSRPRPRFEATLDDGPGRLALVFFNGAWLRTKIHPGMSLRVRGRVKSFRGLPQMTNPKWEVIDLGTEPPAAGRIRPVYPASAELSSESISMMIRANLDTLLDRISEWFDPEYLARLGLCARRESFALIHHPASLSDARIARRRLAHDELILLNLGLAMGRGLRDGRLTAPVMKLDSVLDSRIRARFPWELTDEQQAAAWEIARDLAKPTPMRRLLQGDVGSGKTAVALYAMLVAVANRMQAAFLAPTEVLAEQHHLSISQMLQGSSVRVELLTSRTRRSEGGAVREAIASGAAQIVVGTQALLTGDVRFANLGLVVVDEQHRLGVMQRAILTSRGSAPHYLTMTATPIPRSLALSCFADVDLSTIRSLPPRRQPVATRSVGRADEASAYSHIRQEVAAGRQAYVIVPQIGDDSDDGAASVTALVKRLRSGALRDVRLEALHGQLPIEDKRRVMSGFRDGSIDVLVATTVIEVGIDVPNATVMVIEDADRFGLAQLHQLRGRVGRGGHPSTCYLIADPKSPEAQARIDAILRCSDGFELAEADLKLRGPGQFFGTRQHGLPELKVADLTAETDLLRHAAETARKLLRSDPQLRDHPALRSAVLERFGDAVALSSIG
jgi:ATP-dependent DNA helicase RecG